MCGIKLHSHHSNSLSMIYDMIPNRYPKLTQSNLTPHRYTHRFHLQLCEINGWKTGKTHQSGWYNEDEILTLPIEYPDIFKGLFCQPWYWRISQRSKGITISRVYFLPCSSRVALKDPESRTGSPPILLKKVTWAGKNPAQITLLGYEILR